MTYPWGWVKKYRKNPKETVQGVFCSKNSPIKFKKGAILMLSIGDRVISKTHKEWGVGEVADTINEIVIVWFKKTREKRKCGIDDLEEFTQPELEVEDFRNAFEAALQEHKERLLALPDGSMAVLADVVTTMELKLFSEM